MSVLAAFERTESDHSTLAKRFAWKREAYSELCERFRLLQSKVTNGRPGDYWGAIEDDEAAVARLLLMLQRLRIHEPWLVPITRTYMYVDTTRVCQFKSGRHGEDERDMAVRCRIAIASPDHYLLGFYADASWARGRRPPMEWGKEFNIAPLDDPAIHEHLVWAIAEWQQYIEALGSEIATPPENRVRRIAVLLAELYMDIEDHRMELYECERVAPEIREGRHGARQLTDRSYVIWQRHATVIDAGIKRIDRDLCELLALAEGVATDLEYGLGGEAGPTATRLMSGLKRLYVDFHMRAANPLSDPDDGECGYLWWHFDGTLQSKFKEWWAPIAHDLHEVSMTLEAVTLQAEAPQRGESTARAADGVGRWTTFAEAERNTWINRGTIQRATDNHLIVDNGEKGKSRRISVASLWAWVNGRAADGEAGETDAEVKAQLRKAGL